MTTDLPTITKKEYVVILKRIRSEAYKQCLRMRKNVGEEAKIFLWSYYLHIKMKIDDELPVEELLK